MKAELIAIGSELLLGDLTDTNSAWISQRLAELGVDVHHHVTLGDNEDRIVAALRQASERADIVICTGGLGPTQDDLTRQCFAKLAGVPLVVDKDIEADLVDYLTSHGYPITPNNMAQAQYPETAKTLPRVGTAPGLAMQTAEAMLVAMPGVPREMKTMFTDSVVPIIRQMGGGQVVTVSRVVNTVGIGESQISFRLDGLNQELEKSQEATMAFLASQGKVRIRLTTQKPTRQEALATLDPLVDRVVGIIGQGVVGVDEVAGVQKVAELLIEQNLSVAVAESITAGMVGCELSSIPGASSWFVGGEIVYQNAQKARLLGSDAHVLEDCGPVALSTAAYLAQHIASKSGADVGVSVVGVAGPDEQNGCPVGTVMVGLAGDVPPMPEDFPGYELLSQVNPPVKGNVWLVSRLVQNLGRTDVQKWAVNAAVGLLIQALSARNAS